MGDTPLQISTPSVQLPGALEQIDRNGGLFLSVLQASQDYVAVLGADGCVQFINDRGLSLMDEEHRQDIVGRLWSELWPEDYRQDVERVLSAAGKAETARFRAWHATSGGPPTWWDTMVSPILDRTDGSVVGLLALCHEITAQMRTQSFLDTILDSAPLVLFAKNASDRRYVLVNQEAEEIFGHSRDDILGKTDHELGAHHADRMLEVEADVVRSGAIRVVEDIRGEGENQQVLQTKLLATFGEEGPCHIIGVMEDITDQRRAAVELQEAAERAEAANQSKSAFLANMSHEIRTPLNGVIGVADVLAGTELTGHQREMVDLIRSSGQTLGRLLSDVLDLARIESGRLEIENEPFHLADAARTVAALLEARAHEKSLALKVELAPEADCWVVGDVVRVKQILTNFVGNAIKFTEQGEVRIVVSCPEHQGDRATFRFEVQDTGVGFDASRKEAVFARFQQADGSITRRFGGTGLGLAISKQLAEMMGGEVDCDSAPGVGSVFFAELPMMLTEAPAQSQADAATGLHSGENASDRPLKILLADDHPTNRKVCELILAQIGVDLTSVEDGAQALEAFKTDHFDVVLMDMQMPVMDGLAATRAIRERERTMGLPHTPVFMLTANALAEHIEASRLAGADLHITKPITSAALLTALAQLTVEPEADAAAAAAA